MNLLSSGTRGVLNPLRRLRASHYLVQDEIRPLLSEWPGDENQMTHKLSWRVTLLFLSREGRDTHDLAHRQVWLAPRAKGNSGRGGPRKGVRRHGNTQSGGDNKAQACRIFTVAPAR